MCSEHMRNNHNMHSCCALNCIEVLEGSPRNDPDGELKSPFAPRSITEENAFFFRSQVAVRESA